MGDNGATRGQGDAARAASDVVEEVRGSEGVRGMLKKLEERPERSERACERILETRSEKELMNDEALKLIAAWGHHRKEALGKRDYWLYAIDEKEDRASAVQELGVDSPPVPDRLVMLITVDCMRGDRLSCNGYDRPTTPVIDRLAASGANFPCAYSTAGQTAQSFPGILMSTLFQNFGQNRRVPSHLKTLPEVMKNQGYHTIGINAANPHVSSFYGYDRGVDEYEDFLPDVALADGSSFADDSRGRRAAPRQRELDEVLDDLANKPQIHSALKDLTGLSGPSLARCIVQRSHFYPYSSADILRNLLARLEGLEGGEKVFCWLHLMDLHENISVPYSRLGTFSTVQQYFLDRCNCLAQKGCVLRGQREKYSQLYDAAVSYVDRNLEILRNVLSERDILKRSLVCVTADHGQELFENGVFGHGSDRLNESLVHIPLVLSGGLSNDLKSREMPVSTLDIAPTILDLCEIGDIPNWYLGTTLSSQEPRPVCGQSFYQGAENRAENVSRREFLLSAFPEPVRDYCPEIRYWIEKGCMLVEDRGLGASRMEQLRSAGDNGKGHRSPSSRTLKHRLDKYIEENYLPQEKAETGAFSRHKRDIVESHLEALGYL